MRILNHRPRPSSSGSAGGFSLMETVVAIAIIAVGFLPVLAMLATALQRTSDSKQETIAAQISSSIFAQLRHSSEFVGGVVVQVKSDYPHDSSDPSDDYATRSIASFVSPGLAVGYGYSNQAATVADDFEDTGIQPIDEVSATDAVVIGGDDFITHVARITVSQDDHDPAGGVFDPEFYRVDVSVEFPAAAEPENRRKFVFTSYMNLTDVSDEL